jgi:hypothetical protein
MPAGNLAISIPLIGCHLGWVGVTEQNEDMAFLYEPNYPLINP